MNTRLQNTIACSCDRGCGCRQCLADRKFDEAGPVTDESSEWRRQPRRARQSRPPAHRRSGRRRSYPPIISPPYPLPVFLDRTPDSEPWSVGPDSGGVEPDPPMPDDSPVPSPSPTGPPPTYSYAPPAPQAVVPPSSLAPRNSPPGAAPAANEVAPLAHRVAQNHHYAQRLGWSKHIHAIATLLGFRGRIPTHAELVAAVARWQKAHGIHPASGVLNPRTWQLLCNIIHRHRSPRTPVPVPPVPVPSVPGRVQAACASPTRLTEAERTALAVTTNFETGTPFGCAVSPVSDPDGVSLGMIQWNLRAGTLQTMIRLYEQRGGRLETHFGDLLPALHQLLQMPQKAKADREAVIARARALRQQAPQRWKSAMLSLCVDPLFCRLQVDDIRRRLIAASNAARSLQLKTVRGLAMLFDIEVGDGYALRQNGRPVAGGKITAFQQRIARKSAELKRGLSEQEVLVEIAEEAALFAGRWQVERRARRLVIARGTGVYRGKPWNLDSQFPALTNLLPQ